jgi:hypothetical protein
MNTHLQVTVRKHNIHGDYSCVVCGRIFEENLVAAELHEVKFNDSYNAVHWGDVCPECLDAGKEGAAIRAREHAAALHTYAEEVKSLADKLLGEDTVWAITEADIERAEQELQEAMTA